jgi:hypothetical protein
LRRMAIQEIEQRRAFRLGHAGKADREVAIDEERLAAGLGMGAYDGVLDLSLGLGREGEPSPRGRLGFPTSRLIISCFRRNNAVWALKGSNRSEIKAYRCPAENKRLSRYGCNRARA